MRINKNKNGNKLLHKLKFILVEVKSIFKN